MHKKQINKINGTFTVMTKITVKLLVIILCTLDSSKQTNQLSMSQLVAEMFHSSQPSAPVSMIQSEHQRCRQLWNDLKAYWDRS